MGTPTLEGLPAELQDAIISWIFRKAHLAQVCLVSKQLQSIALPRLYNTVNLVLGKDDQNKIAQLAIPGHSGVSHIRNLKVDLEADERESQKPFSSPKT